MQQLTLWGENLPKRSRRKKHYLQTPKPPYSITGANDCEIIGHTVSVWNLAGCTTCLDCGVSIFCPQCVTAHPIDANAIPIRCNLHESQVSA